MHTDDLLLRDTADRHASLNELANIPDGCSPQQIRILTDILRGAKIAPDQHIR